MVQFTTEGRQKVKANSANEETLLLIKYLPELIEGATDVEHKDATSEKHQKLGDSFYYLRTHYIREGKKIPLEITLKKLHTGDIHYYNHTVNPKEYKNEEAPVSPRTESPSGANVSKADGASFVSSTVPQTKQESKQKETAAQKFSRLQRQLANLIDIDNANGNTEAAYEKYAAIVNRDIPAMERMVQEPQDNLLLTMSDISLAMAEPKSDKANSDKAKTERQAQVESILRVLQNPVISQYATKPLKFNKKLTQDLRAGKSKAIRYAQKLLRDAGIPDLEASEQAKAMRRSILARQKQERRAQRAAQTAPQIQGESQTQAAEPKTSEAPADTNEPQTAQPSQEEPAANTTPQNKPKQKSIPGYAGKTITVTTDSGQKIQVRYRIVPAERLVTSHKFNSGQPTVNQAYPQELQPRDRSRVSMGLQIVEMANKLNPDELGESRNLNQGAPVIRSDGVVLNGNGRVMAIREAQRQNGESAKAYKKSLNSQAQKLGFNVKNLEGKNLILVREVVGEVDDATLKEITTSTTGGSRMGASEQAKTDAEKIKVEDLDSYVENETGDFTTAANQNFVSGILHRVTSKNDVNAYTDENGHANPDGIQRVKRAVFSAAYDDDHLIAKMAESTDDNTRNVSTGLMNAAPIIARLKKLMERGERHEYPLASTIAEAVKRLDNLRENGQTVENYLSTDSMFSEYADSEETKEVLRAFDEFKRSGKKVSRFLRRITELINGQGDPNQTSLMGENETASLLDTIQQARKEARDGDLSGSVFEGDEISSNTVKFSLDSVDTLTDNERRAIDNITDDMTFSEARSQLLGERNRKTAAVLNIFNRVYKASARITQRIRDLFNGLKEARDNAKQARDEYTTVENVRNLERLLRDRGQLREGSYLARDIQRVLNALRNPRDNGGVAEEIPGEFAHMYDRIDKLEKKLKLSGTNLSSRQQNTDSEKTDTPKHSETQGAFSIAQNGQSATIDKSIADKLQKGLAVIAKRLGGTYNHAAGRYDFKDEAALEKFTDAANSLLKILDPATAAKYSITAWHGSPHTFDEFKLTAIGTGEGAQVHGWGLYFAKERSVSEGYREELSGGGSRSLIIIDGEKFTNLDPTDPYGHWIDEDGGKMTAGINRAIGELIQQDYDVEASLEALEAERQRFDENAETEDDYDYWIGLSKEADDAIEFLQSIESPGRLAEENQNNGSLFQVEIPDEDIMLDEQKRLDEQPPKVQAALREIGGKVVEHDAIKINGVYYEWHDGRNAGWYESDTQKIVSMDTARDIAAFLNKTPTKKQKWETHKVEHNDFEGLIGKNIYNELVKKTGSPRKASELLNKHGIKGITYMGGTDGRCYVVFDDQAIKITAKYSAAAEEAQKLLKTIKIVDDSDLTKAQSRFVELGNEMGTTIVWYDGDSRLNGVQEGNVILLNRKAAADLTKTFWHETFHWIKANNQALAAEMVKAVQDAGIITKKQIEAYRKLTSRRDLLTDEAVIEEMLADEFINPAKAHDLMNKLAKADEKNIPLVQRIMAYLKKLADRFIELMQGSRVRPGVKFTEADNALTINERVLTTKQRDAFIGAVGRLANSITDSKGRKIFKTTDHGKGITLADGRALPNVGVGETRFSAIQGDREEIKALRKKYEGTDKWLKAPNGEKTNLTEEQWLNVRTKAFKDWFGDWENDPENASKVVDENGEPLVVYHGSNRRFNTFKKGDLGFHVGTQEQAEVAAEGQVDWTGTGKARIIPVFANIRNPIRIDYDPETWNDMGSNFMHQLRREGIITEKEFSKLNYDGLSYARMRPIREKLQAAGYDGVVYPDWYEFRPGSERRTTFDNSFIALSPNQIKSATDNVGTYSTEDDDIRFSADLNGNVASKATTNRKFSVREQKTVDAAAAIEDNIANEVFERYLNPGIMEMVKNTVSKEIGEHVDLSQMSDPVARDEARDKLPYILKMLERYNLKYVQDNPAYKDRLAVKIEYARRCFDDDERIRHESVRQMDGDAQQEGVYQSRNETLSRSNRGRTSGQLRALYGGVSRSVGHEKHGARERFEKLFEAMASHKNRIRELSRSEEDGFSNARTIDDLKREAKEVYHFANVTEDGDTLHIVMPNGQKVTVTLSENITAPDSELAKARKAHGIKQGAVVTIEGYAETVNGDGFIALSQGSREGTGFHEAYHIAEAMAFTKKELADAKRLISPDEEKRADMYAKWVKARKKHANFAKLWQKIKDIASKLAGLLGHETQRNLFRKVESGEIYKRQNQGRDSEKRYSANATSQSVTQKIKNILSGTPSNDYSHRKLMADLLGKALNLTIRAGKIADQNGKVVYKEADRVLRTKQMYDWENILPVASGIIAERLGIVSKHDQTPAAMRNYITNWILTGNPNDTSQEAKTFQEGMRRNPHLMDALQDVRYAFDQWNNMSAHDQMANSIQMTKQHKTDWKELRNYTYEQFVETLAPVERMVKEIQGEMKKKGQELADAVNPMIAFRLARGAYGRAITMIEGHGAAAVNALKKNFPAVDFTGFKTMHDILQSIDAFQNIEKQREFVEYCIAKHVLDMHAKNERIDNAIAKIREKIHDINLDDDDRSDLELWDKIESLEAQKYTIDKAWSKANCEAEIERGKKKFDQAQKDLVRFSNIGAAILKESGVISRKRYNELTQGWPNYVPLFRVFEENEDINFGDSMKHVQGSLRDMVNPLESIIKNTVEFVKKAENNKARCLLANMARCDGSGFLLEEVDNNTPDDQTTIPFYEDGKRKYLQTDPEVVKAVKRMDADSSNAFLKVLHAITSWARACFTIASPEFAMRNVFRDWADAMIYDKHKGFFSPADIVRGIIHAFKRDEIYYEWLSSGAAISSAVSLDRNYTQEMINKLGQGNSVKRMGMSAADFLRGLLKVVTLRPISGAEQMWKGVKGGASATLETLQKAGEYSEYGTRIGMYEKTKKHRTKGETKQAAYEAMVSAAFESRDLMDFARHGKAGKMWNQVVPFANASLQGMDKFYREFLSKEKWRENPKRATWRLAGAVLAGVLPALILTAISGDDDRWKHAPDWLKETHWLIPMGDEVMVRIPKGNDVAIRFFSNLVEKGLSEKEHSGKEYLMPLWDALPNLIPIALLPLLETRMNKSLFTGISIIPRSQENLPGKLQYSPYSTGLSKFLAEQLDKAGIDVSPRQIDHVIAGYSGSVGMFPWKLIDTLAGDRQLDTAVTEMPLTRALTYMPYKNPQIVQDFYERLDEQTTLANEYKLTGEKPEKLDNALLQRLKNVKKLMSDLNKREKALIDNPNLSVDERREKQIAIQEKRIEAAKKVLGRN